MGRIQDTQKYPFDQDLVLEEYAVGTDVGGATRSYKWRDLWGAFNAAGPRVTMSLNDIDDQGSTFDYHGGIRYTGDWLIIRYDKTTLARLVADENSNPAFTNVNDAWTNRASLIYS
jgi:hypothetical protein